MSARVAPLHADELEDLPERCRRCVFWELGEPRPTEVESPSTSAADRIRKQAWVAATSIDSGPPGVVVRDGRRLVAYALYGPSTAFAPRRNAPPGSADALLLATAWVEPDARSHGVGRLLVQAAVKDALRLGLRAVEAYGDRRAREWDCVLPAVWLLHEGFEVHAEHPRTPLHRIDTRRAVRWTESVEHALGELLGRIGRTAPATAPVASVSTGPRQ